MTLIANLPLWIEKVIACKTDLETISQNCKIANDQINMFSLDDSTVTAMDRL